MVSAHNPFRTPAVTPNPTGVPSASSIPNSSFASSHPDIHDGDSDRARSPSPTPPPEDLPGLHPPSPPPPASRSAPEDINILSEELPPAYTATPDIGHGESTLDVGPRRPFQPAQQHPPQNGRYMSPTPTGWQNSQVTGASWSGYPGQMHAQHTGSSNLAVPPLHPSMTGRGGPPPPHRPSSAPNNTALSDFARDFYAAGPRTGGRGVATEGGSGAAAAGSASSQGGAFTSSGTSSSREGGDLADDGRPTTRPTPGHPLLRNGRVLVYPSGYECPKCHNMGYKHNDPTHPCTKCWEKYSKSFTGALAYAPWSSSGSAESGGTRVSLQRPLPRLSGPQAKHRQTQSVGTPLVRLDPSMQPPNGYHPGSSSYSRVVGNVPMSPYLDPMQRSPFSPPSNMATGRPPPGAAVVHPGDPRIGGRLCWRCGGAGTTTFLIFDEMTCNVCNGLGRTFV